MDGARALRGLRPGWQLTALVVGCAAVLSCCGQPATSAAPPATSTPATVPSRPAPTDGAPPGATPEPSAPAASAWRSLLEIAEDGPVEMAARGDTVYVATADGIVVSESAGAWEVLEPAPEAAWVTQVAAGPRDVVAAGAIVPSDLQAQETGEHPGAAWRLVDGQWIRAAIGAPLPYFDVSDLAWDGSRFVAAGVASCHPWWIMAHIDSVAAMVSTAAASPGGLTCPGRTGYLPMRWTSGDGVAWEADPDPAANTGWIQSIAAGPAGVVAVGHRDDELPAVWLRDASGAWRSQLLPTEVPGRETATDVGFAGDAIVVLGRVAASSTAAARTVAWRSTDAQAWVRSSLDMPVWRLATIPGGLAAIGAAYVDDVDSGAPGEGPDQLPETAVIAVTRDGLTWTRLPDDSALAGMDPADLLVVGGRVILAGSGPGARVLEADASILDVPEER